MILGPLEVEFYVRQRHKELLSEAEYIRKAQKAAHIQPKSKRSRPPLWGNLIKPGRLVVSISKLFPHTWGGNHTSGGNHTWR